MYIEHRDVCIGIVDSDHRSIRSMQSALLGAGYNKVLNETNGIKVINFLERTDPAVLIFADEPIGSLIGAIPQIREFNDQLPIIAIGLINHEDYVAEILDKGADDYLTKSKAQSHKLELPARVMSLLRRVSVSRKWSEQTREVQNGNLKIDFAEHAVFKDDCEVDLSPTEYRLLAELARNVGRTVTHQDILTRCWGIGYEESSAQLVRVFIHRLRGKLDGDGKDVIVTKSGFGYSMPRLTPI